ncbi:GNAT family N-acetyltransferase [Aggregatilineales bacterium SYSU G02658]
MTMDTPDTLITWYLEMTHRAEFRPAFMRLTDGGIERWQPASAEAYRAMYTAVGSQYAWRDRLLMPDEALMAALAAAELHRLVMSGEPAGYVELLPISAAVSIEYLGLIPSFHGRGLGKHLLSYAIARAWEMGAERVIVHTCNLDAPQALDNYLKRGFRIVRETHEPMPERYRA